MTTLPNPDLPFSDTDDHIITSPRTSAASQQVNPNDITSAELYPTPQMAAPEPVALEKVERTGIDARTKISSLLKDREQEWTAVVEKKGPLRLLDLPIDVLKEIVKEVSPGNHDEFRLRHF